MFPDMIRIDGIKRVLAVQEATDTTRRSLILVRPFGGKLLGKFYKTGLR
jgi:putative IMPACT (imprinted ancient) family translation regulator